MSGRSPNLAVTILLYIMGTLLIILAVLLLLQAFGVLPTIPQTAMWALVLLSVGAGILAGLRTRT